ncbi:MAG: tyrosine-protein phosphatase [Atopobiaceae bacterium]|jgi:protein-tyrosine phosphatase|nr:tyrosine-protein phosphatase [Atopobiaceae bacterium]MCI2050725.1 tyrosine-protein phosphatase [Atopobiaceae bacterium]
MAHPAELNWQRLPLTGADNVRDLGGYPVGLRQTKWHAFLRAGKLENVTDEDCEFLHRYGVRMVIDLRSETEVEAAPDRICTENDIAYIHTELGSEDLADPAKITMLEKKCKDGTFNAEDFYLPMLENTQALRTVFRTIAQAPEDACILIHCNAGKDRTGIVSMLLLMLVGVSREDCVADYVRSYPDLFASSEMQAEWASLSPEVQQAFMDMGTHMGSFVYDWIAGKGGARKYLEDACGIPAADLDRIAARLI